MADALPGLRADAAERVRTERVLAVGRAFLTVAGLFAIYLDPTEPRRLQAVAYGVLASYAVYGVVVTCLVYRASRLSQRQVQVLHAIDILWTSALTAVSEGPVSPFFLFFLFTVVAAAFRWAMRETLATAAVVMLVFLAEIAIAQQGRRSELPAAGDELNSIVLRATYLSITGVLLAFLAEQDKRRRSELAALAALARQPRAASGLGGAVTMLSRHVLTVTRPRLVAVVLHDRETSRAMLWRATAEAPRSDDDIPPIELTAAEQRAWLFADAGNAWVWRRRGDGATTTRAAVPGRWPLERRAMILPAEIGVSGEGVIIAANFGLAQEWTGRVYVFDPAHGGRENTVHLLESMIEHATPAITNLFLMRRLRQRASADERARVARELHDGAIQALFGLEMKIEALRRAPDRDAAALDATLVELQDAVRHEVQGLRDLMQALRPIEIDDTHQLEEVVSAMVERFRRDSGISARFVAAAQRVNLSPAIAIEVVRIVQEALVNIRKHSGGRNVLVRLESLAGDACRLTVEDDGRGFGFEGRLDASEMERRRVGPAIIRERARTANAALTIESVTGQGARLELVFG